MDKKKCAFDEKRECNDECVAYKESSGYTFKEAMCLRGNFIIDCER